MRGRGVRKNADSSHYAAFVGVYQWKSRIHSKLAMTCTLSGMESVRASQSESNQIFVSF